MPTIDSSLIPLVTPGNVFPTITENPSLAVRFLVAKDPHFFDVYNRPMGDIVVRQLILAKSIDQLGLRLSHQSNFPFLNPATIDVDTNSISLPLSWIWDMHVSMPDKWENLRLARLQRFPGENNVTDDVHTGVIRFVFTANVVGSASEVGMFYVDYEIDSVLTFQIRNIVPATISEDSNPISSNQHQTLAGFVIFKTIDDDDFLSSLVPPESTGTNSDTDPIDYETTDSVAGGPNITDDFSNVVVSHGTGILVSSSYNVVPPIGVDENSVLMALSYPWRSDTSLVSNDVKSTIPTLLFDQFIITAPIGNRSDSLSEDFKVLLTRIRRLDDSANELQLVFSTNNTIIGSTSDALIEFASVTISRSGNPGDILEISPLMNLRDNVDSSFELFFQNFGSGFMKLSSLWSTDTAINDFFDSFTSIVDEPADRLFNAQLNEFAVHRTPFNIPTIGEAQALAGSTSRREIPIYPSDDNRYVAEKDQGFGDEISFGEFDSNDDISPTGWSGSLVRKSVVLLVNTSNDAKFSYEDDILPRLKKLLGRSPIHGDEWFEGTTFKRYDGVSGSWIG